MSQQSILTAPKVSAFLLALPHADPQSFVSPPGLGGTWRARFIRVGLDRGVLAVHWSGAGLCIVQPSTHGVCKECASRKGTDCQHCNCAMCVWFNLTDERASPRVTREKMMALAARLQTFQFGTPKPPVPALLEDF